MFDENNNIESDLLMRSILSNAQEDVPEHVWDGISAELDRIQAAKVRRPFIIWMKRSAIAVAAAAAITVGLFIEWNGSDNGMIQLPADGPEMIAVAEPTDTAAIIYFADAEDEVTEAFQVMKGTRYVENGTPLVAEQEDEDIKNVSDTSADIIKEHSEGSRKQTTGKTQKSSGSNEGTEPSSLEEWVEDEEYPTKSSRTRTSIILSGITGTNSIRNGNEGGAIRRPSISTAPLTTGIRQTGTESTFGLPLSVGAGVKIGISKRLSIGAGLNYTLLTRKFYGTYTKVNDEGILERHLSSDIKNIQHYIGIPVNLYYNIIDSDHINFYTYAGGTVEKCISNKYDVLSASITHRENTEGLQLSVNAGIGVEFILGKHLGLYIDPSLRYYFNNRQPVSIRTAQPFMMGFEMGLRINL